ncbi:MAG: signal peptidase I [Dehalococcoidales bacterium]|nr:signal peptidase I [Dehalococcoidales bacterium]
MKKAAAYSIFSLSLLSIVITVFVYVAPHLGWSVNSVVSGSMEPALGKGSLIVTRPVDPKELEAGDIILFSSPISSKTMITHRIIDVDYNSLLSLRTQGDANLNPDPYRVPGQNVIGKVVLHVPSIGYFTEFVKKPAGFITLSVVPSVIIFALYAMIIWREIAKNKSQRVEVKVQG